MKILIASLLLFLVSCGQPIEYIVHERTTVTSEPTDPILEAVEEENEYRLANGQLPLVTGLVCTLHNLSLTQPALIPNSPPTAVATFVYVGGFEQSDSANGQLNVLPTQLRSLYSSWYMVRCTGQFIAPTSDYYVFNLSSDDGTNLYLDNALLVGNDGHHGTTVKTASKLLKRGPHAFRLDYMQGNSVSSLTLSNQNEVISGPHFYR